MRFILINTTQHLNDPFIGSHVTGSIVFLRKVLIFRD